MNTLKFGITMIWGEEKTQRGSRKIRKELKHTKHVQNDGGVKEIAKAI